MSSFICESCGTECIDTPEGYVTGCEHYPVEAEHSRRFFISPDGQRVMWLKVYEKQQLHPDWIDATDWPDDELEKFILERGSHDNQ